MSENKSTDKICVVHQINFGALLSSNLTLWRNSENDKNLSIVSGVSGNLRISLVEGIRVKSIGFVQAESISRAWRECSEIVNSKFRNGVHSASARKEERIRCGFSNLIALVLKELDNEFGTVIKNILDHTYN